MFSSRRHTLMPLFLLLTACPSNQTVQSANFPEENFTRSYAVDFDPATQVVELVAQFRMNTFTGDSIQLDRPSYVDVNDGELRLRHGDDKFVNVDGTDYFLSDFGAPRAQYTFNWHKKDGSISSDIVIVAPSIAIASAVTIDRTKALVLAFAGAAALPGEVFEADVETCGSVTSIIAREAAGNSVTFSLRDVGRLCVGQGTFRLKRSTNLTKDDAEGRPMIKLSSTYQSLPVSVTIEGDSN